MKRLACLCAVLAVLSFAPAPARAGGSGFTLARFLGLGWSDGYHSPRHTAGWHAPYRGGYSSGSGLGWYGEPAWNGPAWGPAPSPTPARPPVPQPIPAPAP